MLDIVVGTPLRAGRRAVRRAVQRAVRRAVGKRSQVLSVAVIGSGRGGRIQVVIQIITLSLLPFLCLEQIFLKPDISNL